MFTETQKRILVGVLIISLVSSMIGLLFSFQIQSFGTMLKVLTMGMPQRKFSTNTNILVVGLDNKNEDSIQQRTDTIMLVNINPYTKYVGLLSIPRDVRVHIDGHGQTKVNSAYAYGGVDLLRKSLANALRIQIPYYVIMDLQGVGEVVDLVGGVPIKVEERMHYVDRSGGLYIDLYPGYQVLDGKHAMQYVRFRGDITADLGRIKRQQNFIQALGNRALSLGMIFRAPTMIFRFSKYIKTNIPASLLVDFSFKLKEAYQMGHFDRATIPCEPMILDGVSFLQPDWEKTHQIINRVIRGYEMYNAVLPDFRKPPELPVELLNGSGRKRMGQNAARKLAMLGYPIRGLRNAGRTDYKQTLIVNWHGEATEDEAFALARSLYVNPENIINYNYPKKPLNFSIVLGHDWPITR